MMRLYDSQCMECKAYAVLNGYCRECGFNTNTRKDDACDKQTDSERTSQPDEQDGEIECIEQDQPDIGGES